MKSLLRKRDVQVARKSKGRHGTIGPCRLSGLFELRRQRIVGPNRPTKPCRPRRRSGTTIASADMGADEGPTGSINKREIISTEWWKYGVLVARLRQYKKSVRAIKKSLQSLKENEQLHQQRSLEQNFFVLNKKEIFLTTKNKK